MTVDTNSPVLSFPPAIWLLVTPVSHSGSICPHSFFRSFLTESLTPCLSAALPASLVPSFRLRVAVGSLPRQAGRQAAHPAPKKEKRKEKKNRDALSRQLRLFGSCLAETNRFFYGLCAAIFYGFVWPVWFLWGKMTTCGSCEVHTVCFSVPECFSSRNAWFHCSPVLGLCLSDTQTASPVPKTHLELSGTRHNSEIQTKKSLFTVPHKSITVCICVCV